MTLYRVRGVTETGPAAAAPSFERLRDEDGVIVEVELIEAVRVGEVRGAETKEIEPREGEVVEVELEGGIRLWMSADRLGEMAAPAARGAGGTRLVLPGTLQIGPRSRGTGELALRVLKRLDVNLQGETARAVARKLESQLKPGPGLYRWSGKELTDLESGTSLPGGVPLLLFLHGTASSTSGSFGGLRDADRSGIWDQLARRYQENVFALEHRSLSESPIRNTLDLVKVLPEGAVLHLVSHSRGGLIGELLCRARAIGSEPFGDAAALRFMKAGGPAKYGDDLDALVELSGLMAAKRIRVERFVRVACPARGTTLASGRLDLYLSLIVNAIGLVPGLSHNPIYDFATAFVLAVAKERTDPRSLPGIEAMMPGSPLIGMLNEPGFRVDSDLSVIAGDIQGAGILQRLKVLATDLFYRENHDLVVNSGSMVGGAARPEKASRFLFAKGSEVSHFNYFRNEPTARKLMEALTLPTSAITGFEAITAATAKELKTRAPVAARLGSRPTVMLLPGFMGSHLSVNDAGKPERVWLDLERLAEGRFADLAIGASGVEVDGPLEAGYARLTAHLSSAFEVEPFPYDWRRSLLDAADRLAQRVAARLGESTRPVHLLGHSVGGLVARAMIARRPELWQRLTLGGGRLVMLGTPNAGSYAILRLLAGQAPLLDYLDLLDARNGRAELLKLFASFPGVLELLPAAAEPDFSGAGAWRELREAIGADWTPPDPSALQAARELRTTLSKAPLDGRNLVYVAGNAPTTPVRHRIDLDAPAGERLLFEATTEGDGWVTWNGGRLPGVRTWYMDAQHGEMADYPPAFSAIVELLDRGETRQLPDQPPPTRGGEETFLVRAPEAPFFPDEAELVGAALGFEPRQGVERVEPLAVSVVHGNLAYARHPVAVGHYAGDTINGAEKVLDAHLSRRLSEKRQLNLYPGPIGSSDIFLCEDPELRGAIVVGLGEVGTLTGAKLERSFTQAVLSYAAKLAERKGCGAEEGVRKAGIAALLVGSGRGGIEMGDSVRAILRGTLNARDALRQSPLGARVQVDTLEFWELYEDLAIGATRLLRRIAEDGREAQQIRLEPCLVSRTGGRRRASFGEEDEWWDRMVVVTNRYGDLVFQTPTQRARVEERSIPQQQRVINPFVASAVGQVTDDPALARSLFELLVPNDLKDYEPDRNDMILVVDRTTARFPWELLRNVSTGDAEPMAVKRGLIRQFNTAEFRRNVTSAVTNRVLVVGDPPTTTFPRLTGARDEARRVARQLEGGSFQVTPLVDQDADYRKVLEALYAEPYRILHIAAHGVYRYVTEEEKRRAKRKRRKPRGVTGIVLGDGVFLQPAEMEQVRSVPEVVFLNCCHSGLIEQTGGRYPQLAANLAEQLIRMGVRVVVASGWAVADDAGMTFAEAFYGAMLEGETFGKAVHHARRVTYERHPGINTWGAYQCYGDHGYVLERAGSAVYAPPSTLHFASPQELVIELENLADDADSVLQFGLKELREQLVRIATSIDPGWRRRAPVRAALARAYAQLGMLSPAIRHYRRLEKLDQADYLVEALEQLANLETRATIHFWKRRTRAGRSVDVEKLKQRILDAVRSLEQLPGHRFKSSERYSLIGSAYKRLSQLEALAERIGRLASMAENYRAAQPAGKPKAYPTRNWLAAEVVRRFLETGIDDPDFKAWRRDELLPSLGEADQAAALDELENPDFWSMTAPTDGLLIRYLAEGQLPERADEIVSGYREAWQRRGSVLALRSVTENLEWLIDCLSPGPGTDPAEPAGRGAPAETLAALRAICERVEAFAEESGSRAPDRR